MPCFAMLSSCSMLISCSEHCYLMLFSAMSSNFTKSVNLLSFALLPCLFEPAVLWSSRSSVFIFCQASPVDYCHMICCYVWVLYNCYLLHSKCYHAVNRRFVSFLFCLPFANHASVSGDLYIDFNRNHLIFPAAYLVFQVDALIILSLSEHAYALHIMSCISCHVLHHVACALHRDWLLLHCLCSCFG